MARIITIPNDNDPVMNAERQRIVPWAATSGWSYAGYNNESDHIAQVRRVGGGSTLQYLDFDCHGNPTQFNHTSIGTAVQFGRNLAQSTGFSANTAIFLDACNTGLTSIYGGPIAQAVADGARCKVYGTRGYMTGTFAEGNERCYASPQGLPAYPGAIDAAGRNVWLQFTARSFGDGELPELRSMTVGVDPSGRVWASFDPTTFREAQVIEPNSITVRENMFGMTAFSAVLNNIMNSAPVEFPNFRMAPDVTINYLQERGVRILDVYANGGLLKDRISNETWRVADANELQILILQHRR